MTGLLRRYVSGAMVTLCLLELALGFGIFRLALAPIAGAATGGLAGLLAIGIAAIALAAGLYRPEICLQPRRLLMNVALVGALALPLCVMASNRVDEGAAEPQIWWLAEVVLAWLLCALATRWGFGSAAQRGWFSRRVLIVGAGERAQRLRRVAGTEPRRRFDAIPDGPDLPVPSEHLNPKRLRHLGVWAVVVADDNAAWPVTALLDCKLRGLRVFDDVGFAEQCLGRMDIDQLCAARLIAGDGFAAGRLADAAKRFGDIVVSLMILTLAAPLLLVTALAVRLDSRGPVLSRQQRVGRYGAPFALFGVRCIRADAMSADGRRWSGRRDPRLTRIGALLRATHLDALPQLLNVLRGEMSVVGPSPERPYFADQLSQVVPYYAERNYVKPGLTGWAQVNAPCGDAVQDARDRLAFDLFYVKNRTALLDVLILVATAWVILFRDGILGAEAAS